jgi:hypothetical protein
VRFCQSCLAGEAKSRALLSGLTIQVVRISNFGRSGVFLRSNNYICRVGAPLSHAKRNDVDELPTNCHGTSVSRVAEDFVSKTRSSSHFLFLLTPRHSPLLASSRNVEPHNSRPTKQTGHGKRKRTTRHKQDHGITTYRYLHRLLHSLTRRTLQSLIADAAPSPILPIPLTAHRRFALLPSSAHHACL